MLSEIAAGASARDSDVVKLARRRLEKFVPVSDEFELFRLREFEARCTDALLRSECLKAIGHFTLVKLNQVNLPAPGKKSTPEVPARLKTN